MRPTVRHARTLLFLLLASPGAGCGAGSGGTDGPVAAADAGAGSDGGGGAGDAGSPGADAAVDAAAPDAPPPMCGDGEVRAPEQCDDGNTTPGDGCDADCAFEASVCGKGATLATLVPGVTATGSTLDQENGRSGSCGGASSPEAYYVACSTERADWLVTTDLPGTDFATVVYVTTECSAGVELGCVAGGPAGASFRVPDVAPGCAFVVVDGLSGAAGDYALRLDLVPVLGEGDPCDPTGIADRCEDGTACETDGGAARCQHVATECEMAAFDFPMGTTVPGSTSGQEPAYLPSCSSGTGPEDRLALDVVGSGSDLVLDVTTTGALDAIVEIATACDDPGSALACSDASGAASGPDAEVAVVTDAAPGLYFGTVDGWSGAAGDYEATAYQRVLHGAGQPCDRALRASRCTGDTYCMAGAGGATVCTGAEPVLDVSPNYDPCSNAQGPYAVDFAYAGDITGGGDTDVIELDPSADARLVAVAYTAGGACDLDLDLRLLGGGDCEVFPAIEPGELAADDDSGLGPCPYLDTDAAGVTLTGGQRYWLEVSRGEDFGSGTYLLVVDFVY